MKYTIMIVLVLTGCTGPFGIVVGSERVHELYTERFDRPQIRFVGGDMDYYTAGDKQGLQRELDKTRRY